MTPSQRLFSGGPSIHATGGLKALAGLVSCIGPSMHYGVVGGRGTMPATRFTVTVKASATTHEVQWGKVEVRLQSAGKPNEMGLKNRLLEVLRR